MAETIFSKIIRREIPADIVYEDDAVLAFRDIQPQAPVHVLVIPAEHFDDVPAVAEADPALASELLALAAQVARQEGVSESGHRLVANTGLEGGQSVGHAHIHVLGGRPLGWPPG